MSDRERRSVWQRIRGDDWLLLGLLGSLLGLSLFFVHVPAELWARNTAEFHSRFDAFLPLTASLMAVGLLGTYVVLRLLPRAARLTMASLLCGVGLVAWFYAFMLASNMTVLNGLDAPMDFDTPLGVWELPLLGVVCALIAGGTARIPRAAIAGLLALNVGLAAVTATTVAAARNRTMRAPAVREPGDLTVFRFSPHENVLIVLLDSLQSDVAAEIFRRDPDLKSAFDGFHFYRNTLAVAPTTFLSLPSIHSGAAYRGRRTAADHFEQSIRLQSFMSRFADAGYETVLVNPAQGVCPDGITTCISSAQLLRSSDAQRRREIVRLLDLSLFRVSPVWLKRHIYDGGNWTLAKWLFLSEDVGRIVEHNLVLEQMARRLTISEGAPSLKFIHSMATHTPFILNSDCRTFVESTAEANIEPQVQCALTEVAGLLRALNALDAYDQTEILLLADHGMGRPSRYTNRSPGERAWARRVGYANPVFMLKPRHSRGELTEAAAEVYLPDVGATLCRSSGACTARSGVPVGHAPPGRPRRFLDYEWRHEFWDLREIPQMTAYEVRGPLWKAAAWRVVGDGSGLSEPQPRTGGSPAINREALR